MVHCEPVGNGEAAFKYLAPYIFRVAISNNRVIKLEDGKVTFTCKESASHQVKYSTVSAEEFIRRFLQHVLPDRFVKVRYYGLLSPGNRHLLEQARRSLAVRPTETQTNDNPLREDEGDAPRCPQCGNILIRPRQLAALGEAEQAVRIRQSAFAIQMGRSPP